MAEQEPATVESVPITINGREVLARPGELVIAAAERHGVYIPHFCYHPRMTPVGMCRMCIVEVDSGRGPSLQPTCMLEVSAGMRIDTESPATRKAQEGVLEFLLINHPLDCPVCDKGGECPLQDQAMAYGPGESRFVEEKRHYAKPIPISDLVLLDRERCILCDRCTRFAKEVAGDPLIHFVHRGSATEVNTFPDHPFASYFSGNTVQICPVGALTATTYRFRARPWDLEVAESTCQTCAVGCRMSVQTSRNEVLRYVGVDIDPVNWGWLCDRGRFNFQAVSSGDRLTAPLVRERRDDDLRSARWAEALASATRAIRDALERSGPAGVAVLGGSRCTNEGAYAWAKLAKGVIGTDHVDAQLGDGLPAEVVLGMPRATIDDACRAGGTVLLLGPDLKEELPVLFLRLRHAIVDDGVTVIEISPAPTGLSPLAAVSMHPRPGAQAALVAALLGGAADPRDTGVAPEVVDAGRRLLEGVERVTVVLGRQSLAESPQGCVDAAAVLLGAPFEVGVLSALRRGNVHGALDMGLAPGVLPGRVSLEDGREWFGHLWPGVPAERGADAVGILRAAADGRLDTLVLLGADPLADFPDHDLAVRALAGARTVIAVDQFLTESSSLADVVLPAAGFAEVDGTTTNLEGRVSTLRQVVTPPGTARADWSIAAELAQRLGSDLGVASVSELTAEIERVAPAYAGVTPRALETGRGLDGLVVPLQVDPSRPAPVPGPPGEDGSATGEATAESTTGEVTSGAADGDATTTGPQPPPLLRFEPGAVEEPPAVDSYSLRLIVTRRLYDRAVGTTRSPALAGLAPGTRLRVNRYDFDRLGVQEGASVRVSSSRGSLSVEIAVDDGVPRGSAALEVNQPPVRATELIDATQRVTDVRVTAGGGA